MTPPRPLDPAALLEQSGWLRSLVRGLIREEALAEDVVQETWVAALEQRPAWDRPGGARAWLASVARNLALRARRREFLRRTVERQGARSEGTPGGQDALERMQLQERLAAAVLALDEPYRTAVLLRHVDGHSHSEVARRQGCTPAAARQRVGRGLAMLRARLEGELGGRENWCLALARLAAASGNGGVLAAAGALMGTKVAVAAGGCALVAALWWGLAEERRDVSAVAPEELGVVAREPSRSPVDATDASAAGPVLRGPAPAGGRLVSGSGGDLDRLSGLVTDTRGRPLERAVVGLSAAASALAPGAPVSSPVGTDGRFTIELASARPDASITLDFSCPGFLAERAACTPGQELVMALRTLPGFAGTLRDEDGAPVAPPGKVVLTVAAFDGGEATEREGEIGPDGSFAFAELAPGRVTRLWARARGYAHRELEPDLVLVPDRVQRMDVELPSGALVTGVVVDERTREPLPGARVWIESPTYEGEGKLHPATIADEQGRFRLEGVETEAHRAGGVEYAIFRLLGDAPGHIASPARGYGAVPSEEQEYEFEVALAPTGASLELVLHQPDGSPAAHVQVFVADSQGNHGFESADERGRFVRHDLPAGVLALRILGDGAHGSLDLELQPGETRREELVLRADGVCIRGRVSDAQGRPLEVELSLDQHLVAPTVRIALEDRTAKSDATGAYAFTGLPPGHFIVRPDSSLCPLPERATLDTGEDESVVVDFVLGACMEVAGRVEPGTTRLDLLRVELRDPETGTVCVTTQPEADGTFRLDPCFAGSYDLVLLLDEKELDRISVGPARSSGLVLRARP